MKYLETNFYQNFPNPSIINFAHSHLVPFDSLVTYWQCGTINLEKPLVGKRRKGRMNTDTQSERQADQHSGR